jgi:periplasmic protein CpxP/Spy
MKPSARPIALTLCLAASASALPARAAPLEAIGGPAAAPLDQHLERMSRDLKLTPEQESQVRKLLDEQRDAMRKLRQDTKTKIDALLTDEQRAELARLADRRIERRVDRLADRLDLTDDQAAKIAAIFKEGRDDPSLSRVDLRERIGAVLTDDQRKKLESFAERRSRHEHRGRFDDRLGPDKPGEPESRL